MKETVRKLITTALGKLKAAGTLPSDIDPNIKVEHTRDKQFGDLACNVAMMLAKPMKRNPRELAQLIIDHIPASNLIKKIEIAGPGFINVYLNEFAQHDIIPTILKAGPSFGHSEYGKNELVHIEFVSANPTGPLHVGHGRGAAYGAACADLLAAIGYNVHREYYVNDAGRQMDILALSVWLRYLEAYGEPFTFPSNAYQGDYVKTVASQLREQHSDTLKHPIADIFKDLPDEDDKDAYIDTLIANAKHCLGDQYKTVHHLALHSQLSDIREDLHGFGLDYENWFSEQDLFEQKLIPHCVGLLTEKGHTFEEEGNLWFRATAFGDDKDRVLIRKNGQPTYFASDIAYHLNKFERGADHVIDIFGADHHGYAPRVKAALKALDHGNRQFEVRLVQFASLYRGEEKVQMSTRSGSFVTLRELREEVGKDAVRFFYVMRKSEQHLDFDIKLATSKSTDNPVYYIQYAHARICSVKRQAPEKGIVLDQAKGLEHLTTLTTEHEKKLIDKLICYPEVLHAAAIDREPHLLVYYLRELANFFHTYYNAHQFIVEDEAIRNARFCLINAVQFVIAGGLALLGVSAPETM